MKRRAYRKNAPAGLHLSFFAVLWLLMDRFDPPGWVWGVVATLALVLAVAFAYDFFTSEDIELPKEPKP